MSKTTRFTFEFTIHIYIYILHHLQSKIYRTQCIAYTVNSTVYFLHFTRFCSVWNQKYSLSQLFSVSFPVCRRYFSSWFVSFSHRFPFVHYSLQFCILHTLPVKTSHYSLFVVLRFTKYNMYAPQFNVQNVEHRKQNCRLVECSVQKISIRAQLDASESMKITEICTFLNVILSKT